MVKIPVYNTEGVAAGEMELDPSVFGVKVSVPLVHQVYNAQRANARGVYAHTKTRGEVQGGGKKPWKQKGTGRARHGSIRSPLWRGGGITFGPRSNRNFSEKINKKMKSAATKMCLSDKVREGRMVVIEGLGALPPKTKAHVRVVSKLPLHMKKTLFLEGRGEAGSAVAMRNIARIEVVRTADANVVDLLHHPYVLVSREGVAALTVRLKKEK